MLVDEARLKQIEEWTERATPGPRLYVTDLCETLRVAWQQRDEARAQVQKLREALVAVRHLRTSRLPEEKIDLALKHLQSILQEAPP